METYAIFNMGTTEMIIVLVVLLLLFGSRLPSIMRSLGKSATEFKKGMNDFSDEAFTPTSSPSASAPAQSQEAPAEAAGAGGEEKPSD